MFPVFEKYLTDKITITRAELDLIQSVGIVKKLRKHQYLLQQGDVWRYHAFVCAGCLRSYRVDDKGNEHITYVSVENYWSGDSESLLTGNPAKSNIDAIEDTTILLFTADNFSMLKENIPVFKDFMDLLINRSFAAAQNRIHSAISLTAEEKYQNFITNMPFLANRIPQHMIASYLGISPETLSRVRKNFVKK